MAVHVPVLLNEMVTFLAPQAGKVYIDATFGGGGYTRAILERADCSVYAIDRDPEAQERSNQFQSAYGDRFHFLFGTFGQMDAVLPCGLSYDGIVFDFGVSSFQLEDAERGFSFQLDGPLDMRMGNAGLSAEDVVNTYSQEQLYEIIKSYGEEKKAYAIAKAIVESRQEGRISTTRQLATLVQRIVRRKDGIHPATLTFQALRIFVNNELIEIDRALGKCLSLVPVGGRIVTVTFHSLEDRIVKNWMRNHTMATSLFKTCIKPLVNKVVAPSVDEVRQNPRARSAKLRAFEVVNRGEYC
jgi:16S rRNA (cytosine1402-N4)-methyltransferase